MNTSERFTAAIRRFDAANAEDPNREAVDGRERPKALLYAERVSAMLARFAPDASEALLLAARCQHLERWKIPRSEYPMTRAGYHQWRNRLRDFHAELARAILDEAGYDDAMIARVASLIRKEALKSDAEAQALEDVVALVFLESYLAEFVAAHDDYEPSRLADIVTKTARKMSQRGRAAALSQIRLPPELAELVRNAIGGVPPGSR
ncbi:MAG TPA: DUF4202 domain-containing protein [Casimicrobiaceae bacterium]|nr:DUF4202 domain-containing protein [Casimicrobiaceae bacterium]